ncbi:MAG: penicillin-binding protein 2 [Phycisphaerae bacterium]|nr:penicillin-binding protein 2 [Phycisphaerae bacterium]
MNPVVDRSRRIRIWSTVLLLGVSLAIVATTARVVQLKTDPDPRLVRAMEHPDGTPMQYLRRTEPMPRGVIYDRRGQVVAMDIPSQGLFIDPRMILREALKDAEKAEKSFIRARKKDPNAPRPEISLDPISDAVVAVAERLGVSPADMLREVMKRVPADLQTLRSNLTDEELRRVPRYISLKDELTDAELDSLHGVRIPGIGIEDRPKRVYPFGHTAASLIGFVGEEHKGLGGIELRQEKQLDSKAGSVVRLVDNRSQTIAIPNDGYIAGEAGEAFQLSIDMIIQEIVERVLEETVDFANAGGGRAIVVDVETGEILAMYDVLKDRPGRSIIGTDKARDIHPALGRNRCVTDPYEPGSTFKPFVWATATQLGVFRPTDTLNTPSAGGYVVSDGKHSRLIRDVKYYGPSTWERVLEKSMNAGMAIAAMKMTKKQLQDAVHNFGFGELTRCGLPGESRGIVTSPKNWTMLHTQCSVAIGQEISVTAVQMVRAFTAFCRDGSLVELSLERVDPRVGPRTKDVISEKTAITTREAMRGVMTEGTGHRANKIAEYDMFGKSGTAQLVKPKGGGYYEDRYTSSFIAGAPLNDPKIAVLVVIDDPDKHKLGYNNYGGGAIAGPAAATIVNETLKYMGIPTQHELDDEKKPLAAAN